MMVLDLFCGGGGAGEGYRRAGFRVTGVDTADHSRSYGYVGEFCQMTWEEGLEKYGRYASFIHASPPCQDYSALTKWSRKENRAVHDSFDGEGSGSKHPRLIGPVRDALEATGIPYVIENVGGARGSLRSGLTFELCAWSFGFETYRHRVFEKSPGIILEGIRHREHMVPTSSPGHFVPGTFMGVGGHFAPVELGREVMDAQWMTVDEISEAIPPYFTHWIGNQVREHFGLPVLLPCPVERRSGPAARELIWGRVPDRPDFPAFF